VKVIDFETARFDKMQKKRKTSSRKSRVRRWMGSRPAEPTMVTHSSSSDMVRNGYIEISPAAVFVFFEGLALADFNPENCLLLK
jgi:hypothetical protein